MAFIVFEGLDGAGKSSLIEGLKQRLLDMQQDFVFTREPGGTPLAEELREIILRNEGEAPCPRAELLLYEAARAQHVNKFIKPSLDENKWVICDRFTASTFAFQKGGRSLNETDIHWLNSFATDGLKADISILLDLPVEVSKQRTNQRVEATGVEKDRFELEADDFHQKVRKAYLELAQLEKDSWIVLDATKSPEEVKKDFFTALVQKGFLSE
ncbi:MAG: dTMP kinase [Bdellovibrionaceae bacterium]|nr:dTMP kinase [Pseudobdellovibrionaceae bacterium]|tara:strand:- start:106627 stop:107265 length:639 start_codon:yes stop_codon:yes gene_type:complete